MTDKQIIIDGENIERIKTLLFEGQRGAISTKTFEAIIEALERKEQECEELKKYLNQIRDEELSHLDIEWDEYETSARQEDYSNIITLVERALGEIDD